MAVETFQTLIARNKRNSVLLIAVFVVVFIGIGLLFGSVEGNGDWTFTVGVAGGAAVLAFFLTLLSYYGGPSMLMSVSGATEITKEYDPQLFNVVEELTIAAGTPMPRIFLIHDTAMNAFATGRNPQNALVAITAGLRQKLTRDELQGVMGHELSHVRNYDILYGTLMAVMVGTLVILCDLFLRSVWWGGQSRVDRREREQSGAGRAILLIIAIVLAILAPLLAKIIQMALSRQREYLADAGSVELTRNPQGLANALAKIAGDTDVLEAANRATAPLYIVHPINKLESGEEDRPESVFDTHPPVKERIARLLALEG